MTDPATEPDDEERLLLEVLAAQEQGLDPNLAEVLESLPSARRSTFIERLESIDRMRGLLKRGGRGGRGSPAGRPDPAQPAFAGYRLERKLGEGSLGVVYEAFDETLQRRVALKVLRGGSSPRIVEEARRAAGLQHPSIVTIHSIATGSKSSPGEPATAIVMELVEGFPIDRVARPLDLRHRVQLLLSVARGLAAAHAQRIVHRDLKPDNILVTPALEAKILDFGLALDANTPAETGVFAGTPLYASPEQVEGGRIGPASDVFSFGSIMFQLLTGQAPFEADAVERVFDKIRREPIPFPRQIEPDLPESLQAVCLACLSRDPAKRPSAQALCSDLSRFLAGDEVRLRPALYRDLLGRQVAEHLDHLNHWQRQGMISPVESDRVRSVLRRVVADEDHWILDARKLSPPQMILNTGIWLVVVAVALLVWLGRDDLSATARWVLPNLGFGVLLLLGIALQLRGQIETAAVLLSGAVLTAVPAMLALFSAFDWLLLRPEGIAQLLEAPYSNQQILAACALGLSLSIIALLALRYTALAWTTAVLGVMTWFAWLLTRNYLELKPEIQALWALPLVLLDGVALLAEARGRVRWALPFHSIALLSLVLSLDVMAESGTTLELLGLFPTLSHSRSEGYSFALNGLLLVALALLLEHSRSLDLRRGARILEILAPLHLLAGLYVNAAASQAPALDLAAYLAGVLLLLLLSPWRNRRRFLMAGLGGLALGSHLLIHQEIFRPVPFLYYLGGGGLLAAFLTWRHVNRTR